MQESWLFAQKNFPAEIAPEIKLAQVYKRWEKGMNDFNLIRAQE